MDCIHYGVSDLHASQFQTHYFILNGKITFLCLGEWAGIQSQNFWDYFLVALVTLSTKDPRTGTLKATVLLYQMALPFGSLDGDCEARGGARGLLMRDIS